MDKYSTVIYTTAANLDASNLLAELLGYGPNDFSVPLGDTEDGPVTHYGLHTYATQGFVDMLTDATKGILPIVNGMTADEVAAIVSQWTVSIELGITRLPITHFEEVITPLCRVLKG